jgi:hypothetical protein
LIDGEKRRSTRRRKRTGKDKVGEAKLKWRGERGGNKS